jgi:NAD(P)-dependent dehydrogenase (short-subunit alcohol dehydrogenase family)
MMECATYGQTYLEPSGTMAGNVCVVTGVDSGIGKATALKLADLGASVVMVCRGRHRGEQALEDAECRVRNGSLELMLCNMLVPCRLYSIRPSSYRIPFIAVF